MDPISINIYTSTITRYYQGAHKHSPAYNVPDNRLRGSPPFRKETAYIEVTHDNFGTFHSYSISEQDNTISLREGIINIPLLELIIRSKLR